MSKHRLPETGFLRLPEVLKVFPVSKSTWWAGIKKDKYPKPVKLGPKMTAWRVEDKGSSGLYSCSVGSQSDLIECFLRKRGQ